MNSSVIIVFFFYLTVSNGLDIKSDLSVNKTSKPDDLIVLKISDTAAANKSLNASSAAALVAIKGSTVKPADLEISNRSLGKQNVTDSSEVAPRIGLDLEQHRPDVGLGVIHPDNGFVPSFLKTFRRKRNLVVKEDESNY